MGKHDSAPYYCGLPLVEIRPQDAATREAYEARGIRYLVAADRITPISVFSIIALFFLILILPRFGLCFILGALLAAPIAIISRLWLLHRSNRLMEASRALEVYRFEGKPTRRHYAGFGRVLPAALRPQGPSVAEVLVPGFIVCSQNDQRCLRRAKPSRVSFGAPPRREIPGQLTTTESQELLWRATQQYNLGLVRLIFLLPTAGFALAIPANPYMSLLSQVLCLVSLVVGCDQVRIGVLQLSRAHRLDGDARSRLGLKSIPAASMVMVKAMDRCPSLEEAFSLVEVLPSGVIWTIDGRPAPWRLEATLPDAIPARLTVTPPPVRALP